MTSDLEREEGARARIYAEIQARYEKAEDAVQRARSVASELRTTLLAAEAKLKECVGRNIQTKAYLVEPTKMVIVEWRGESTVEVRVIDLKVVQQVGRVE